MNRGTRDATEREGGEQRAEQDSPETHGGSAARALRPQDPAIRWHVDRRLNVRAFHRQPHFLRHRADIERDVRLPPDAHALLAGAHGDDEFAAILAHRDRLPVVRERGDFRLAGQLDEEVFAEAAAQREIELRDALTFAERDFVRAAIHRHRRARDGFRAADREIDFLARPRLPGGREVRISRLENRRESRDGHIPNRRRDEMPAFDPRIVRARGERERVPDREPALPRKRLLLRAEPHLDEAVLHDCIGREHVFAREQRNAQRDRFADRREPCDNRAHLPDEPEFEGAVDRHDVLQILPLVGRRRRFGFLF